MMRRGLLFRSLPLVYAQHLFLETSPECFKIGTKNAEDWLCMSKDLCWWNPFRLFVMMEQNPMVQFCNCAALELSQELANGQCSAFIPRSKAPILWDWFLERKQKREDPRSQVWRLFTYVKHVVGACAQRGSSFMLASSWTWRFYSIILCQTICVDWTSWWHNPTLQFCNHSYNPWILTWACH